MPPKRCLQKFHPKGALKVPKGTYKMSPGYLQSRVPCRTILDGEGDTFLRWGVGTRLMGGIQFFSTFSQFCWEVGVIKKKEISWGGADFVSVEKNFIVKIHTN